MAAPASSSSSARPAAARPKAAAPPVGAVWVMPDGTEHELALKHVATDLHSIFNGPPVPAGTLGCAPHPVATLWAYNASLPSGEQYVPGACPREYAQKHAWARDAKGRAIIGPVLVLATNGVTSITRATLAAMRAAVDTGVCALPPTAPTSTKAPKPAAAAKAAAAAATATTTATATATTTATAAAAAATRPPQPPPSAAVAHAVAAASEPSLTGGAAHARGRAGSVASAASSVASGASSRGSRRSAVAARAKIQAELAAKPDESEDEDDSDFGEADVSTSDSGTEDDDEDGDSDAFTDGGDDM